VVNWFGNERSAPATAGDSEEKGKGNMGELIALSEAKKIASRRTIAEAVTSGRLAVYVSGVDRRKRLVREDDVRRISEARPLIAGGRSSDPQLQAS
jgi:hypothetical protein